MLVGITVDKDINLIDRSGKICHFIEVSPNAPRPLLSDARRRGLGVSWRTGWSIMLADPTFVAEMHKVTQASLKVLAQQYNPLALTAYMGYLFDARLPGDRSVTEATIIQNTSLVLEFLPVTLLLENAPLGPGDAPTWSLEPDFIERVVLATGCGLSLNLAHVFVNAERLNLTPEDYLAALPLEATIHLRLSGVRRSVERGTLYVARSMVGARELELLELAMERAKPKAIVLDYGGDEPEEVTTQVSAVCKVAGLPDLTRGPGED